MFTKIISIILLFLISPLLLVISFFIILESGFPIIHTSTRIGINSKKFLMFKFRTMKKNTPQLATHLMIDADYYLTKFGKLLRKTSLDELPQLFNILKGDMNFVGPRPALYNQYDLIALRKRYKLDKIKPGITGLAQISGRDNLTTKRKISYDLLYLKNATVCLDAIILFLTTVKLTKFNEILH